jgi:protein involved in polysaccharide export with SLBB domain
LRKGARIGSKGIPQYSPQGVSVLGEVAKPGVYPVLGPRTLLDILSDAGGKTALAGTNITIQRRNGARQVVTATMTNDPGETLAGERVHIQPMEDRILIYYCATLSWPEL